MGNVGSKDESVMMRLTPLLKAKLRGLKEALYWSQFGSLRKSQIDRASYRDAIVAKMPVVQKIIWDSNECISDMCLLGLKIPTDKSPLTIDNKFRHAYTPIYNLMFAPYKNKQINVAEIGIRNGYGLQMFREFFTRANLYGFEYEETYLKQVSALQLQNTRLFSIDVRDEKSIEKAFRDAQVSFEIIIDDSTHVVEDQLSVVRTCTQFLNPGGALIIEDIFDNEKSPEVLFENVIQELEDEFVFSSFIYPKNRRSFVGPYDNEKLLVLIKQ